MQERETGRGSIAQHLERHWIQKTSWVQNHLGKEGKEDLLRPLSQTAARTKPKERNSARKRNSLEGGGYKSLPGLLGIPNTLGCVISHIFTRSKHEAS